MSISLRWRLLVAVLGAAALTLMVVPGAAAAAPAVPSRVIDGCTIVPNPTSDHYTDCPGTNLSDADFAYTDLAYADLAGSQLVGATFPGADLSGTDLSGADLSAVSSGGIIGFPAALPADWSIIDGYLIGPAADPLVRQPLRDRSDDG